MLIDTLLEISYSAFAIVFFFYTIDKTEELEREADMRMYKSEKRTHRASLVLWWIYFLAILLAGSGPCSTLVEEIATITVWVIMGLISAGNAILKMAKLSVYPDKHIDTDLFLMFFLGLIMGPFLLPFSAIFGTWEKEKGIRNPFYKKEED